MSIEEKFTRIFKHIEDKINRLEAKLAQLDEVVETINMDETLEAKKKALRGLPERWYDRKRDVLEANG